MELQTIGFGYGAIIIIGHAFGLMIGAALFLELHDRWQELSNQYKYAFRCAALVMLWLTLYGLYIYYQVNL